MRNLARPKVFLIAVAVSVGLASMSIAQTVDVGAVLKEAEQAAEKLDASLAKANMLASLEIAYAKRGDRQRAIQLLDRVVNMTLKIPRGPNSDWGLYFLPARAIEEQARLGDVAGALRNANAMRVRYHLKVPEFGDVAKGQAEAGDIDGAWTTCDQIDPQWGDLKGRALMDVVAALAERQRFDAALQTVDRIKKVPAKDNDTAEMNRASRNNSLFTIAYEQAKCGQLNEALQTTERTNRDLIKVRTFQEIAKVRLNQGDQPGAREAVRRALPAFLRLDPPERRAFWRMAVSQAEVGDVQGALETTSKFIEGPAKGYALLSISIAQAKVGDRAKSAQTFKEGLALARPGKAKNWGTDDYAAATQQAHAGEFDRALEIARFIERQADVLREVVEGLAKAGDFRRALEIADLIKDRARQKSTALREIAAVQAKSKQPLARQTFQRAFEAAMADKDEVIALKELGFAQLRAGYVDAAADSFREARKRAIRLDAMQELDEIARAQAAGGDPTGALTWARSQSSPLFKACSLVGVVEGLTQGPGE
jgi:tetratricopeptide (TPR) repeat protein